MPAEPRPELAALVGSWRLLSAVSTFTDSGETSEPWGAEPEGRMVLEPAGRIVFLFTRKDCKPPTDDAQRARMFNETAAYSGIVRLDGPGRLITTVDVAKNPEMKGEVVRMFRLEGDYLIIQTPEMELDQYPGRKIVGNVMFVREHPKP